MAAPKKDAFEEMAQPLTMIAAAASSGGSAELSAQLAEMLGLMRGKYLKEQAEEQQKEDELKKLLEARSISFQEEIAGRKRAQEHCGHRKENQYPRIGGQRLSNGTVFYLCQYCGKEWHGAELPPSLAINGEFIGG